MSKMDIGQRYKRSLIGPFWLTITMAIYILGVGPVYGTLFKQDMHTYLPHLALGLVTWALLTNIWLDACVAFSNYRNLMISTKLPFTIYIMRVVLRNVIIFFHNLLAIIPFLIFLKVNVTADWWLALPGLLLMVITALPGAFILAILCTRFRDLQPITASIIQLCFFLTPILWTPASFSDTVTILHYNPFWWLLEIVRGPLLNRVPSAYMYEGVFAVCALLTFIAAVLFVKFRRRISFWI